MTVSGSLVQVNGRQRSFRASMKRSMAATRSATVGTLPRRSACRVMIEKKGLDQVQPGSRGRGEVQLDPGMALQPGPHHRMLVGGQVVDDHVQLPARIGGGHLLEEGQELLRAEAKSASWV
jgi:hypothetical protein